jgi:hypothetical protein
MKSLFDAEAHTVAVVLRFVNKLSSVDLLPLMEMLGQPGNRIPEVCRKLGEIECKLCDD